MFNLKIAKVFKNGSALVVALPANICRDLQIERGDFVSIFVGENDTICFQKLNESAQNHLKPKIIKIT